MNRTLIALALITTTSTASALDCNQFATLAEHVMRSHQSGVPLTSVMSNFEENVSSAAARKVLKKMAVLAYEQPRYSTDKFQRKAIAEFRDDFATACYARH